MDECSRDEMTRGVVKVVVMWLSKHTQSYSNDDPYVF